MDKYNLHVDKSDYYAPYGYNIGHAVAPLLKQCGDNLTRENIMDKATHLNSFNGERYVLFSDVLASE